jgi:hypothetical protein
MKCDKARREFMIPFFIQDNDVDKDNNSDEGLERNCS